VLWKFISKDKLKCIYKFTIRSEFRGKICVDWILHSPEYCFDTKMVFIVKVMNLTFILFL